MKTYNHHFENMTRFANFLDKITIQDTDQVLVRIHSAIHTKEEMTGLARQIKRLMAGAHIIGCSAMQVIMDGKILSDACLISVSVFEKTEIMTGRFNCLREDGTWKSGQTLGHELVHRLSGVGDGFMLVFFPLVYSKIEEFVNTVNESDLSVKMLGGAASMEDEHGNAGADLAYVLEADETSDTDMVFAYITSPELHIYENYVCGVETVGKRSKIKSQGCYIEEVDAMKGAQWYSSMLGEEELQKDPTLAHVFPIIKRNGRGIAYYVDYVKEKEEDSYQLKSFGELENGCEISLGYFHPQKIYDLIRQLMKELKSQPAESIFAYDCQSRMNLLHNCASWENGLFNTTNISGALLSGEISSSEGENLYANYTFVIAALSEQEDAHFILNDLNISSIQDLQEDNVQMLNYLLLNANKHLSEELTDQQSKMQDAMFYNATLGLGNQLKYQYDKECRGLDKTAILVLNNEKMFRLFSGVSQTYAFLKDSYQKMRQKFTLDGLHFYSYNDTSLLLAADAQVTKDAFLQLVDDMQAYLNTLTYEEIPLSYTAAVLFSVEDALRRLETALRYAKNHKLSRIRFDELGDGLRKEQEDIHMLWVIREALLHRRVMPFFQEIHDNGHGKKRMFESLMRLYDEDGKIYYPDSFLPVAKEYDLYDSLSELMVKTVMEMFERKNVRVTINLNVQDIYNHNMIRMIFHKMRRTKHPDNFVFEIVESEEITDYEYIKEFADRIHEYGGKVAIDDFGSGFSNLLHILNIEADYIKIDGAIIRMITKDPHCRDFIEFINSWCEKAGQELICEYIENEQIQNIMEEIGVRHSQGYYFSKPHKWSTEDEASA